MPQRLCRLDDIPDPGGKSFAPPGAEPFFVVRVGRRVWGYVNRCPHRGLPLDWRPDTFLNYYATAIQCAMHGAQFRIEDGLCLAGPCPGESLEPVAVELAGDDVVLACSEGS